MAKESIQDDLNRLIVIGASAGGVDALMKIVSALPRGLPAPVLIVLHVGARSILPLVLARSGNLPVSHARDGDTIKKGHIYVAPPNYHMLVKPGYIRLIMGPKEDYHRPAINPLFRTAASAYGNRTVGVILTGALDDGAIGLKSIKHHGGVAIVQDPRDAVVPYMPLNAIRNDEVDHILKLVKIPPLLVELAKTNPDGYHRWDPSKIEPDILELGMKDMKEKVVSGKKTGFICPECGGPLWQKDEKGLLNFRCHVGHAFSAAVMEEANSDNVEAALWNAVRILEEKSDLLKRIAPQTNGGKGEGSSGPYATEAQRAHQGAELIRKYIYEKEKGKGKRDQGQGKKREGRKK